jgi:adenylylsulfate kinase-like enzyme
MEETSPFKYIRDARRQRMKNNRFIRVWAPLARVKIARETKQAMDSNGGRL